MQAEEDCQFQMEAVNLESLSTFQPDDIFPYVISSPITCPPCGEPWVLLVDKPLALEVELGHFGKTHIEILTGAMIQSCRSQDGKCHFRTDGKQVWDPDRTPEF